MNGTKSYKSYRSVRPKTRVKIEKPCPGILESTNFEASLYQKSRGASFSGWIVRHKTDRHLYTDPIAKERTARLYMRRMELLIARGEEPRL